MVYLVWAWHLFTAQQRPVSFLWASTVAGHPLPGLAWVPRVTSPAWLPPMWVQPSPRRL